MSAKIGIRLSWRSATTKDQRSATSRGNCADQRAWRPDQDRPASVSLNAVRMTAQEQTARTNIEDVGLGTSIERLGQQRMREGNQRDVRLLG